LTQELIKERKRQKIEKYTDLKYELPKVWKGKVTKAFILSVIIGALGMTTNKVQNNLDKLKIGSKAGDLHKIGLLGTSRILRN
jgi:hypothetical protein